MIPLQFVIALPRIGDGASREFRLAASAEDALEFSPSIWFDPATPVIQLGHEAWIAGFAFSGSLTAKPDEITAELARHDTVEAKARWLSAHIWGGYIALLRDRHQRNWHIFSDPSGLLPVLAIERDGTLILASHARLLFRASRQTPTVCFDGLALHLRRPEIPQRTTCLVGIDELEPGTLLDPGGAGAQPIAIWQASDFVPQGAAASISEAAERLREVAIQTMDGWAMVFGKVAVAASGGVDSSLICAALADAHRTFDCITVSTQDRAGDERSFAKEVAEAFSARCAVRFYEAALYDPQRTASAGLARPSRRSFVSVFDDLLRQAMDELGASVVVDGNGGDNLFCFLHSAAPVFDRLRHEGLGRGAWQSLVEMCRITGCSVPTMMMAVLRRCDNRRSDHISPDESLFLNPEAAPGAPTPLRRWTAPGLDARSGTFAHLSLIAHAHNQIHPLTCPQPRFSPLHSQPLIECCLGLPSWIWASGGINRAPARLAFADALPRSTIGRVSKTGPDSFVRSAFAQHRSAIAGRLLEGLLAGHALLDRRAVELALCVDEVTDSTTIERLLDLLEAENWAQSWVR